MKVLATKGVKKRRGLVLAEATAALAVLLPVSVLLLFVISEMAYCYMVKTVLSDASRLAARTMAIQYGITPAIAGGQDAQGLRDAVLNQIRIPNIIVNNEQFSVTFNTDMAVRTVHVDVDYQGGLWVPPLPMPDPLGLGKDYRIHADATYRLE